MNIRAVSLAIAHRFRSAELWLVLSLAFAALYGGLALQEAFSSEYVIQDDARVYLIWMQRFLDPQLFPQDLMADYFQSVTPWGLGTLYRMMAMGISPLVFSKLLPLVLSLLVGWYGYRLTVQLFPIPIAGFFSSVILLQSCWQRDDLASASPRSFWELLLIAFLYYLARQAWILLAITVLVMSLFCPLSAVLIALFISLRCLWFVGSSIRANRVRSLKRSSLRSWIAADWFPKPLRLELGILVLTIAALLPYVLSQSEFAPTVTAAQARTMPEFLPGGRLPFFFPSFFGFWLDGTDSGIQITANPPLITIGLLLPWLLKFRPQIPLLKQLRSEWKLLPQLALSGVVGFLIAHIMFAKLHFPSRYTTHSWRVAMAISAGIVLAIGLNSLLNWARQARSSVRNLLVHGMVGVWIVAAALYPHLVWKEFPKMGYVTGGNPALYRFLQASPKSSLTAYLGLDGSNLPMFGQRSTLTAQEYAVPFHLGYYNQIRQRTIELLKAQYSPDLALAKRLIQQYRINYWLIDQAAFKPEYLRSYRWFRLFEPETGRAIAYLKAGKLGAIAQVMPQCRLTTAGGVTILDGQCILKQKQISAAPTDAV
ncbi:hypothetical protein C7B65_08900 [Phormidesmis priestleyi ULC007]|uniref:Glycosyltransferase RgtA/B/C/D-like domain-containing protein n=1 Tax=Phormidesmis priestleyi ULC007 TaxID=1920490 RepID=A0A2T1DI42_9CYAN|nr:hypothetical protein [Phormidesmis priestleyi]PSB20158.1 hypothetical protein C7B65_08900 [Phormidesmis priestleyi ULC007]PZO49088.1 MAG: hypothetical protein DCF14_15220 [Phormidesmis priestleyi]